MKQYYYLLTSLKDISVDQEKLDINFQELIENIFRETNSFDRKLVDLILLEYDNRNLVKILNKEGNLLDRGVLPISELEERLKYEEGLPEYMLKFYQAYKAGERLYPESLLEDELSIYYYDSLRNAKNRFFRDFFEFRYQMKNFLVALTCKKFGLARDKKVLDLDLFAENLKFSNAPDFALTHDFEWAARLMMIHDIKNAYEREKAIIKFEFDYLDEVLLYNYFGIEKVLAYLVKLQTMERFLALDEKVGREFLERVSEKLSDEKILFRDKKV